MKTNAVCLFAAGIALAGMGAAPLHGQNASAAVCPAGLVVHEWGTFTSLQDETGRAIGGINTDDEPVPDFVHNVAENLLIPPTEMPLTLSKAAPSCHPDVTMRLETPVLYVHAPDDFRGPLDVRVAFKGGWLTQFYPQATPHTPGGNMSGWNYGRLTDKTVGSLEWLGLGANATGDEPKTTERVWLAPRTVQASELKTPDGETERFLFYRGVGHLDAPLRVVRSADSRTLDFLPGETPSAGALPIGKLWLVDIHADGKAAWRTFGPVAPDGSSTAKLASTPAQFATGEYSTAAVDGLRTSLRAALVTDGLFADEADALLNTWEVSYFKSAGLRLFFLVPQTWTDRVLPLTISGAPPVTRTMVGRIEIVTPHQRDLLAHIAAAATETDERMLSAAVMAVVRAPAADQSLFRDLWLGKKNLAGVGVTVPAAYRSYLNLGRFRNALVLDEERRGKNAAIKKFIEDFRLQGYSVPSGIALAR